MRTCPNNAYPSRSETEGIVTSIAIYASAILAGAIGKRSYRTGIDAA